MTGLQKKTLIKYLANRAEIVLGTGDVAIVDIEDVDKIKSYHWRRGTSTRPRKSPYGYVQSVKWDKSLKKNRLIRMHHLILGKPPEKMVTDHKNGNPLDNRKNNLRFVSYKENRMNRRKKL